MVSLIADALLERLVGPYARLGQRKLDLTGGTLLLTNVELRHDILDGLGLPITVRGGEVGELEITVPWTKLRTDSVVVRIHRLSLLLAPVSEGEWDETAERKRAAAQKERELAALRARTTSGAEPPATVAAGSSADSSGGGWIERLMQRVLDNLQIVVTSAVVRYEDYSHSGSPFGIELAMDSLWFHPAHVESADASHRPVAASSGRSRDAPPFRHREALVCALCAYMLPAEKLLPEPARRALNSEALRARLEASGLAVDAPAAMRLNAYACLLEPVSFALEACSREAITSPPTTGASASSDTGTAAAAAAAAAVAAQQLPRHVVCVETGRITLRLQLAQVAHLAAALAYCSRFAFTEPHRQFRPRLAQRPATHPRAWWRYAGDAIRYQVRAQIE